MLKRLLLSSLSIFLMSCGNYTNVKAPLDGKQMGGGQPTTSTTELDFATIKSEILQSQCINCHTGRHKNYENYAFVKPSVDSMLERMETSDPGRLMPKGGPPLSTSQIAMFKEWVQAGAPEFANKAAQPKQPAPSPIDGLSFLTIREKVLKPYNCTACHSQYNDYGPTFKDRGAIISLVSSDQMPFPKPRQNKDDVVKVSDADKKLLLDWVGQGAPEKAGQSAGPLKPETLKPTFISLRNNVFGPKCVLCHNSFGNRGFGKSFGTFRNLRKWMAEHAADPEKENLFVFNAAEGESQGLFLDSMLRDPNDPFEIFTPMPFNSNKDDVQATIPRVTDEEIAVIKEWIKLELPYDEEDL